MSVQNVIKNYNELISHGYEEEREPVLSMLEAGLKASDPLNNLRGMMRLEGKTLIIDPNLVEIDPLKKGKLEKREFHLSNYKNIYALGVGKAAQRMARGVEEVMGEWITDGQVNFKEGEEEYLEIINGNPSGHPRANENSVKGAKRIMEIARKAGKGDLVFYFFSGGHSATGMLPPSGDGVNITLDDLLAVQDMLYFEKGAPIWDLNAWRNVVSGIKAGRLERELKDSTVIRFITNEKWPPGRIGRVHTGGNSYDMAINTLKKYELWDRSPKCITDFLEEADPVVGPVPINEVREITDRWYKVSAMRNEYMLQATIKKAREMSIETCLFCSSLTGEAKTVSEVMSRAILEIRYDMRPFKPPFAYIIGGEITVEVGKATGLGGRNQEFALSSAKIIREPRNKREKNVIIVSVDSDGTDGPTEDAGGIIDGYTMDRIEELKIDFDSELSNHNSNYVLRELGDAIHIGVRGTNVQDLRVIYIFDN